MRCRWTRYDTQMTSDDDAIVGLADAERDQYFLSAPDKLALLVQAAGIRPTDDVVEIGAGIGSVARSLPESASLTLVELDGRFTDILKDRVPQAVVIQGDALALIRELPCDVLLSNLSREPTRELIEILPHLNVRTAVVATGENPGLDLLKEHFTVEVLTEISGDDFKPAQPVKSLLVKLSRTAALG